jgi:hypothetical protein
MHWVGSVESTLEQSDIRIRRGRAKQQPFHVTVGVIDPSSFDVASALSALNQSIPTWPTIALSHPDVVSGYL